MAHGCEGGGVADVGDWLPGGLGLELKDWEEPEEEERGLAEWQGWVGGGFAGLGGGGAGACFLVPAKETPVRTLMREPNKPIYQNCSLRIRPEPSGLLPENLKQGFSHFYY